MAADPILIKRLDDLSKHMSGAAETLAGKTTGDWFKFNRGGGGPRFSADYPLDAPDYAGLFTREELNAAYLAELEGGGVYSQLRAQMARVQSEMLQAVQRSSTVRYTRSRLWACAAAYTRCNAIAKSGSAKRIVEVVNGISSGTSS